ncbi:hypothetical protein BDN70DRAFT_809556 [Pholiota conissans]|uniref:B-block binding subunit of TFIIIC domain-containing protein n=1 Tax=Pholiota conissans TaxID=109636 RepID=A0A9P6CSB0_9AGAR|nr:hypothetical protein BDN70DRAFT_809556 [Pholiota conissans]
MDELLHHCLRELAFDGDLGSDVSRLKDFIVDFYAHTNASHAQNPDDAFCAFVWSLVVEQPTVMVGLIEPGMKSEVWIAPQISAKRKAIARGEDHMESLPPKLQPIPEPKSISLDVLRGTHGDRLRLSVEPDAIFAAVTGSHIRVSAIVQSPKMSPMVYSALQIITRGRDAGVTVVDLGKLSGYDQKTCFYLVRQLTELDLVVKVRRGGIGTHFCIHKYFFERSSSWKAIRDEEAQAENSHAKTQQFEQDLAEGDGDIEDPNSLNFTPIDARHLSSLPLISGRVIKLLKASKNYIHASNNMLITLGFSNPTKTDRRFFQSRIREMIQQGLIEKVVVPNNRKKSLNTSVKCFRLVKQDVSAAAQTGLAVSDVDDDMDDVFLGNNGIKLNATIHKQIIDLLEDSGTTGMTLNDLSTSLCHFDRRTIELLLARADKSHPPPHLNDLRIVSLMETSGRERRHRYFTVVSYQKLLVDEALDNSRATMEPNAIDLDNVGGFFPIPEDQFYETERQLAAYANSFKEGGTPRTTKPKKVPKNPILPNGTVKRGRPRKSEAKVGEVPNSTTESQRKGKRKRSDISEVPESSSTALDEYHRENPSKRARLGGNYAEESSSSATTPSSRTRLAKSTTTIPDELNESIQFPKKRGRPQKKTSKSINVSENAEETVISSPSDAKEHTSMLNGHSTAHEDAMLDGNGDVGSLEGAPLSLHLPIPTISPGTESHSQHDQSLSEYRDDGIAQGLSDLTANIEHGGEGPELVTATPAASQSTTIHEFPSIVSMSAIARSNNLEGNPGENDLITGSKSSAYTSPIVPPITGIGRVNVSHLRRESELLRLLENAGGIINIQTKEFYASHMKLLDSLAQAGEPTSAPVGTRIDKRTATATIDNLEQKRKIRQLKTSVTTLSGINRPACIVYLPHIDQSKLNTFLAELSQSQPPASHLTQFIKIAKRLDYGAHSPSTCRGILPLQLLQLEQPGDNDKERWSKNLDRANQLFTYNESTIREVLLAERTTMAQFYGFIVGKALRCRQLHLSIVGALDRLDSSSHIVSHDRRIIDLSFFYQDISLELYCSLISPLAYDEEITSFFSTEERRKTLVRDLPRSLQSTLQLGKSRGRSRLLDMFEILHSLELVTPLEPSTSDSAFITCQSNGQHPCAFDKASMDGWTSSTPTIAPIYWYIHSEAPLRLWAISETRPPVWKTVSVVTHGNALAYWDDLQEACNNPEVIPSAQELVEGTPVPVSLGAARSLRRMVSWRADYFLSWHQTQYLKQYIDTSPISTPLQIIDDQERDSQLAKICWITSAPRDVIENYFFTIREKLIKSAEKMKQKAKRSQKRTDETKLSLAKKAEEARIQREQEWLTLLSKVHPESLSGAAVIRMERVRAQFLQSGYGMDIGKWEREIQSVIREADLASKSLKISHKRTPFIRQPLSQPAGIHVAPSEVSIQELIELQGPPEKYAITKRKRKKDEVALGPDPPKKQRRHRFQWNSDFDELARDASAIIRARCRNLSRLDWAAFEQVFPSVPRNTVRQRLSHIKETPGNEAYLRRLEDAWYDLWVTHKGTLDLPDDNDQSASDFDLIRHIEFLRAHIDKHALRVGLAQTAETTTFMLPASLKDLQECFDIVQVEKTAPEWDFMWNALIEEGREKKLKRYVLSRYPELFPPSKPLESDVIILAEGTLKMVMGTPPERYKPEQASSLLKSRGDEAINTATKNLLSRGILSKSQRDPQKQRPGRQLKISEINQNAIGGSIAQETFQDAISLLEEIDPADNSWHEWPLTATDGDCATLIELVSDDKVDFNIDTSFPQAARAALDWNSKKTGIWLCRRIRVIDI